MYIRGQIKNCSAHQLFMYKKILKSLLLLYFHLSKLTEFGFSVKDKKGIKVFDFELIQTQVSSNQKQMTIIEHLFSVNY